MAERELTVADMTCEDIYQKLRRMANQIEKYRVRLYADDEHSEKMGGDKALVQDVDDKLFHIQSELRDVCDLIG